MLMPKRTKYRRVQRGRMKGAASRGNKIAYGEFGIQAMEPGWIPVTPSVAAKSGSRFSPTSLFRRRRSASVWAPVKARPNTGLQS